MAKGVVDREAPTVVDTVRRATVSAVTPIALPTGRFHDEGEIGRGGTGEVHAIFDKTLLRRCAMKRLSPRLSPFPEDRQRFIEEAQITGQLDHPNIVPVHELSVSGDGGLYFTMRLVEGHSLEQILVTRQSDVRRLDWVVAFLDILVKVCDAVAFAHSRGVIHRDLKPGNIMVGTFGQVYVTDWGLARLIDGRSAVAVGRDRERQSLDQPGHVMGTSAYMSPEQALGDHDGTDERSDIYGLGATLYQILTAHAPHEAPEEAERLARARAGVVRPLDQYAQSARLPRSLGRIAMKAMAADPAARYQTATALRDDLVWVLRGGADLPRRTFAAGELVMREGEPGDAAYIIVKGTCRVFKVLDGEEIELRHLGPGEVFGETAIFTAEPRSASVQVLEALTVQVVTPEELEEAVGMNTGLGAFVRTLAQRFREVDDRLTTLEASLVRSES